MTFSRTTIRHLSEGVALTVLLCFSTVGHAASDQAGFFDAVKMGADREYVFNDVIEFSLFDMSEIKFINDSKEVVVTREGQRKKIKALDEAQSVLLELPRQFYKSLKGHILAGEVPVTLYPANSPAYAKPLELFVKIKRIHLKPHHALDENSYVQPVSMRIFGQIKDKKSGEILIKFYDVHEASFQLGKNAATGAFDELANRLMHDLAAYLKTKY